MGLRALKGKAGLGGVQKKVDQVSKYKARTGVRHFWDEYTCKLTGGRHVTLPD